MFFFNTRKQAREFAGKQEHYKVVDCGIDSKRRWAVHVLK
jgi:hypothetical protein